MPTQEAGGVLPEPTFMGLIPVYVPEGIIVLQRNRSPDRVGVLLRDITANPLFVAGDSARAVQKGIDFVEQRRVEVPTSIAWTGDLFIVGEDNPNFRWPFLL